MTKNESRRRSWRATATMSMDRREIDRLLKRLAGHGAAALLAALVAMPGGHHH